jgi:hypothetical protein
MTFGGPEINFFKAMVFILLARPQHRFLKIPGRNFYVGHVGEKIKRVEKFLKALDF